MRVLHPYHIHTNLFLLLRSTRWQTTVKVEPRKEGKWRVIWCSVFCYWCHWLVSTMTNVVTIFIVKCQINTQLTIWLWFSRPSPQRRLMFLINNVLRLVHTDCGNGNRKNRLYWTLLVVVAFAAGRHKVQCNPFLMEKISELPLPLPQSVWTSL